MAAAPNYTTFMLTRLFAGLGVGRLFGLSFSMFTECWQNSRRGGHRVAEPVRARRLTDQEGRRLIQIVPRGKGESIRVRRAMMIMASASGTPVPAIARLVAADEDTVRDAIHACNERGLALPGPLTRLAARLLLKPGGHSAGPHSTCPPTSTIRVCPTSTFMTVHQRFRLSASTGADGARVLVLGAFGRAPGFPFGTITTGTISGKDIAVTLEPTDLDELELAELLLDADRSDDRAWAAEDYEWIVRHDVA
jgi:hypothetical protein